MTYSHMESRPEGKCAVLKHNVNNECVFGVKEKI